MLNLSFKTLEKCRVHHSKIGEDVMARMGQWTNQCGLDVELLVSWKNVRFASTTESLVHLDLRRRDKPPVWIHPDTLPRCRGYAHPWQQMKMLEIVYQESKAYHYSHDCVEHGVQEQAYHHSHDCVEHGVKEQAHLNLCNLSHAQVLILTTDHVTYPYQ